MAISTGTLHRAGKIYSFHPVAPIGQAGADNSTGLGGARDALARKRRALAPCACRT